MADTTDKKTYLINIESNLKKYIDELIEAKKREADAKKSIEDLKTGHFKSREEIEKVNAAYRQAKTDVNYATKMVDLATKANKAEAGSYEQLYRQWQLAQTQLKLMGNAYTLNEKGVRILSQRYIDQSKVVADAKASLDAFGKGVHDNRLNVGSYSEAIEGALGKFRMMPGALGQAAGGVQRLGMAFKALLANPIVLIISAVVGAFTLLIKAFKNSQPLMDLWQKTTAMISATFKVLLDRVTNFAEFIGSIFNKELRESRKEAKALNDQLIGIEDTMTRKEKREIRRANRKGLFEEIKEEAKAAGELVTAEDILEDAEIAWIRRKEELTRNIAENINASKEENLTNTERLKLINDAIAMQDELTSKEVEFAKERARISQEKIDQGRTSREDIRKNQELQAAADEAVAEGERAKKRMLSERLALINKIRDAAIKEMEASKKDLTDQIENYKKWIDEHKNIDLENAQEKEEWEKERELINQENLLAIRENNNDNIFDLERKRLEMQHQAELANAEKTGADINLINEKFASAQRQIDIAERDAKLQLYSDFVGNLATIFGEHTAIGKAAAVAQTAISTYAAAQKAYESLVVIPIVGPALGIVAAAAAVAAGIANVKKILAVKSGLPGEGAVSAPTSITASIPAQRSFALPVGSTIFTQPQLSQTQLNAIPSQSLLTAEDIANALSKMPAPIVTVEDINAKAASKQKIEVRANI
jgi:hypothetical protein